MKHPKAADAALTSFLTIGERLHAAGAYTAAARSLEIAVTRGEDVGKASYLLGQCYEQLDRPASAADAFAQARALGFQE
ncbi:MAG: hypothetical protein ACOCZ8_00500 [Bacteroidota bacterium]